MLVVMPRERSPSRIRRIIALAGLTFTVGLIGCADAPRGPYQFRDYSDTTRVGGDFIEMVAYKPGNKDDHLRPPKLLYPLDRMVFSHYPRELVYRWQPAEGAPPDAEYLFEYDFVCGNDEKFGDWSEQPGPTFAYRTGKTTLNDRFMGAQPGRWRVKVIAKSGESDWSEWRYFRFTR
jgi:hypothetical protein